MRGVHRRLLAVVSGLLLGLTGVVCPPATASSPVAGKPAVPTRLSVSIDRLSPVALTPGTRLGVSGQVRNDTDSVWIDAQVYLSVSFEPATTRAALDEFGVGGSREFGDRVVRYGLFAELGAVKPGDSKHYRLGIPAGQLPISGASGVYHVGVVVVAGTPGEPRATAASTDTLVPYFDEEAPRLRPTRVITILPITAPVARQRDGTFTDDRLAVELSPGGRLRNVMDFALGAPAGSLQLMLDPALHDALRAMSTGYAVQSLLQRTAGEEPSDGQGQQAAAQWMDDLETLATRQSLSLLPWGNPATSALADAMLPGVVDASVRASRRYASVNAFSTDIVDWQGNGASSRRGLVVARQAGATTHLISETSLKRPRAVDHTEYPSPWVSVGTQRGPLATVVTPTDFAGSVFGADLDAVAFRQRLMAESFVRSLESAVSTTMVVAAPFHWNPGDVAESSDIASGYFFPTVQLTPLDSLLQRPPQKYSGPVTFPDHLPDLPSSLLESVKGLRDSGRIFTELLTDARQAVMVFDQALAMAGSSTAAWHPRRSEALNRRTTQALDAQIKQVTVTGPTLVALSGRTGSFPLTIRNGLDVPVTVQVLVTPQNPALEVADTDPVQLDAGQTRDLEIITRSEGSGLTSVRARLATPTARTFGQPWSFDVRATQIGVVIWVVMAALLAALFGAAAVRIVSRVRARGFTPRGDTFA